MTMRSPPHPGEGIKDDLDTLGLSIAEAARGLGVTHQQLRNVIAGKNGITPELAVRLEKGIGGTAESWIGLQRAFDLAEVRKREPEILVDRLRARPDTEAA